MRATHGAAMNERHGTEGFKQKKRAILGDIPVVCAIARACLCLWHQAETGARLVQVELGDGGSRHDFGRDVWQL
jgi:hypothetical protein